MEINNYMTPNEAADRWGVKIETLKERLKPSRNKKIDDMIAGGLVKYYKHPNKARGEWIISKEFMEEFYGKENKKD